LSECRDSKYERGRHDAWLRMLKLCLDELGYETLAEMVKGLSSESKPPEAESPHAENGQAAR